MPTLGELSSRKVYVPAFLLIALAFWWLLIRPASIARREQRESQVREHERMRELEEKKLALKELESFHWQKTSMGGDMIQSVDVHFPTMRMRFDTTSRYGDESRDFDVRRKPEGTWEQRLTSHHQLAALDFLRRLRKKAESYESVPEDERSEDDNPYVETHGLIQDDEWSLDGIARAVQRVQKNEWHEGVLRELAPQVEVQYSRFIRS